MNKIIKTNSAEYCSIHQWIQRHYGKAFKCENPECKSVNIKRFEWALIKGKQHKKDIGHYIQLCTSCHKKYDYTETHRKNISLSKLAGTKRNKKIKSTDENGISITYRSISDARKFSGASLSAIYASLNNKEIKWGKYKHLKWELIKSTTL